MAQIRLLDLQALIHRQELQAQELQPTLDSLCLLLKDSNHKVYMKKSACLGYWLTQQLIKVHAGQGVPQRHPGAASSGAAVRRGSSQLQQQLLPCLGETLPATY